MNAARCIGLGLVAACAALLTAGCAAGQHAATAEESPAIDGSVGATLGDIHLRAVAVLAPATGTSYPRGASAPVTVVFVNTGHTADALTDVATNAASGWGVFLDRAALPASASAAPSGATPASAGSAAAAGKSVAIPAGGRVGFGVPSSTRVIGLTGLTGTLFTAQTITVTFTFTDAGTVSLAVPVQLSTRPQNSILPSVPGAP